MEVLNSEILCAFVLSGKAFSDVFDFRPDKSVHLASFDGDCFDQKKKTFLKSEAWVKIKNKNKSITTVGVD